MLKLLSQKLDCFVVVLKLRYLPGIKLVTNTMAYGNYVNDIAGLSQRCGL